MCTLYHLIFIHFQNVGIISATSCMYCLCVNVYCHRVTTQLQLINIYHKSKSRPFNTNTPQRIISRDKRSKDGNWTQSNSFISSSQCHRPISMLVFYAAAVHSFSLQSNSCNLMLLPPDHPIILWSRARLKPDGTRWSEGETGECGG